MLSLGVVPILTAPVLAFGHVETANFQQIIYMAIAGSFLPMLVLDRKEEKGWIVFSLIVNAGILLSIQQLLIGFDVSFYNSIERGTYGYSIPPFLNHFSIVIALYAVFGKHLAPANETNRVEQEEESNQSASIVEKKTLSVTEPVVEQHIQTELEKIQMLTEAKRVAAYIEDEKGELTLKKTVGGLDELPELNSTFYLTNNDSYQNLIGSGRQLVFDCIDQDQTRAFYKSYQYTGVLASLEIPFYNGLASAGVVRCELDASQAKFEAEKLAAIDVLVNKYASSLSLNPKKLQQAKEQFEEQKKLIVEQNKELKSQQKELETALKTQKETQKELAKKEAEARSLLKSISDHNYVFEYNRRGDIIWLNEKSLDLFDMTLEEVRGMNWSEFDLSFVKSDGLAFNLGKSFWRDLLNGRSIKRETRVAVNGNETWVAATFLPILDENGKPVRILGIAQDITDIHNQREKIKEQNKLLVDTQEEIIRINNDLEERVKERTKEINAKNEQLVEYTYINAHMLRAPVCNILGLVELLDGSELKEENKDVINYLHKAAFELDDIVNKINETLRKGYKLDRNEWKSKANQAILEKEGVEV